MSFGYPTRPYSERRDPARLAYRFVRRSSLVAVWLQEQAAKFGVPFVELTGAETTKKPL